jgi:alkylation response protein AidB-like acyl-CoA dehydrogenase
MTYLTEERRLIQDTARKFAMKEVLPVANELDPVQGDMPMALRDKLAGMGYFGIMIPEEFGGMGLGCFEYCLVTEELARCWMSVASLIARGNGLIGSSRNMNAAQREQWLRRMARGEFLGAFSLSEPNAGSDVARAATASTGCSTARSTGAPSPTGPTSSWCWCARARRSTRRASTWASAPS